jgi:hypothetical protein
MNTMPPPPAESVAIANLRHEAERAAEHRGHSLGRWRHWAGHDGHEAAYCRRCWKKADIDILREPHVAGQAISEACPPRPDAFLAKQHPADLWGGVR